MLRTETPGTPGGLCLLHTAAVRGQMYDPAIQRALMEKLAHWRTLPEEDLLNMLSADQRLRFRPEALQDLEGEGLIRVTWSGDEPVVAITPLGEHWVAQHHG